MQCSRCGQELKHAKDPIRAASGGVRAYRTGPLVCENPQCAMFLRNYRYAVPPNTGMKADAAGVPAGDGESSTRGAAYA
jgi:hypothetical protein